LARRRPGGVKLLLLLKCYVQSCLFDTLCCSLLALLAAPLIK
jgi:hypothetical protein